MSRITRRATFTMVCAAFVSGTAPPTGMSVPPGLPGMGAQPHISGLPDHVLPEYIPEYIEEASTPFRAPPDSAEVADLLERWQADGGLRNARERILGARLWRRAGEAEAALALLGTLPETGPSAALARLERARILFELGDDYQAARRAPLDWYAACRAVSTLDADDARTLRAQIWRDISTLATPEEHEAWPSVSNEAACDWLSELIEERAFRMAVTSVKRLAMHYDRLEAVRRLFYLDRPRFYVGMTHWHGRRDSVWMDDRGLVYMRMGPPNETVSCGGLSGFGDDPLNADLLASCWIYNRPQGYKLYYFSTADKVTGLISADGDYYLQETLGPRAHPGDMYFQKYVTQADLPQPIVRHLKLNAQLLVRGDPFAAGLDRAEAQHYRQAAKIELRRFADEALVEIPDVPAVTGGTMLWEALRFLNPADGRWQVWLVASVPAGQLHPLHDYDTWVYQAKGWLASRHADVVRLDSMVNRTVVGDELPEDAGIPLRTFRVADPGPLPITLSVTDPTRPGFGAWVQDTLMIPRVLPLPTVSDIAVAQREGSDWTRDGENFLDVSPDHVTNADGSIFVYFEVYGVRRTADYEVEIRLTRNENPDEVFELEAADVPFRLGFRSTMPYSRIGTHMLRLDLGDTEPGEYDLAVRVRDLATGTPSLPSITPIVVSDS